MVQPIDYATLAGGFQSPQEAFMNVLQVRQSVVKQEKEAAEKLSMKKDLEDYKSAPTPQKLANLQLNYPSLKGSLDAYTQTLSDADKRTTTDFATQAFGLNRAGKTDQVLSLFDTYINAATESGRPDMARVLKDSKKTFETIGDLEPNESLKAREALIGSVLAGTGKDGLELYDKIWNAQEGAKLDTATIKNLQAEGYVLGTPEFAAAMKAEREKITTTLPGGGFYTGSPAGLAQILGGQPSPSNVQKGPPRRPTTKEEFDKLPPGSIFIDPNGVTREKPGGQTSATQSGNFR
jgi:hypothetical protein